jgi:hypothetical protein
MLLAIIVLSGLACTPHNDTEIVGIYKFEDSKEKETIALDEFHVYRWSSFSKVTNQSINEEGTWKFDTIGGGHVTLKYYDPIEQTTKIRGSKAIENWFGKMYLGMSDDGGRLYKKME